MQARRRARDEHHLLPGRDRARESEGEQQRLRLRIERTDGSGTQLWKDERPMVAVTFSELIEVLEPYFELQVLEHDYQRLAAWDGKSGNALVVCVRKSKMCAALRDF